MTQASGSQDAESRQTKQLLLISYIPALSSLILFYYYYYPDHSPPSLISHFVLHLTESYTHKKGPLSRALVSVYSVFDYGVLADYFIVVRLRISPYPSKQQQEKAKFTCSLFSTLRRFIRLPCHGFLACQSLDAIGCARVKRQSISTTCY